MSQEVEAGDVVQLKSGGPKMTVECIEGKEAICSWCEEKAGMKSGRFPVVVLEKVSKEIPVAFL